MYLHKDNRELFHNAILLASQKVEVSEDNIEKHGNMRKENNHAVISVRKNLFTDGEGIWEDQKRRRRNIRHAAVANGRKCIKNTP